MAYFEELLPEFRKGAKIRLIGSRDDEYYYIKHNVIYNQNGTPIKDFSLSMVMADIWELYQEPIDWDYIIKNIWNLSQMKFSCAEPRTSLKIGKLKKKSGKLKSDLSTKSLESLKTAQNV